MTIIFFISSKTVNINKYNIKDIPGSSGRLDVISRCILATLIENERLEKNVQIWVFLDDYGTFIFKSEFFTYDNFPKNELRFTDHFVKLLLEDHTVKDLSLNPLSSVKESKMNLIEAINYFTQLDYDLYILSEQGQDFFMLLNGIKENENIVFIIGAQEDDYLYSKELTALKIPTLSVGTQFYLASSVIRLLKLYILAL
jgi:tRNA (pseudouridine54-N1)-methyltransferase